jgi:hypothetical protein
VMSSRAASIAGDLASRLRAEILSLFLELDAAAHLDIEVLVARTPPVGPARWRENKASRLRRHPPLRAFLLELSPQPAPL